MEEQVAVDDHRANVQTYTRGTCPAKDSHPREIDDDLTMSPPSSPQSCRGGCDGAAALGESESTALSSPNDGGNNSALLVVDLRLHLAVWDNDLAMVQELVLQDGLLSMQDSCGHTPLGLAIRLRRLEIVRHLLEFNANILCRDADGFRLEAHLPRAFPEADALLAAGSAAVARQALDRWHAKALTLAEQLQALPDCEIALTWAFATWVPAVGRLLPQDTVRVRKMGPRLRVDYTLKNFSGLHWQHGSCSVLACPDAGGAVYLLDHDERTVDSVEQKLLRPPQSEEELTEQATRQRRRALKRGELDSGDLVIQDLGRTAACGIFRKCEVFEMTGLKYRTMLLPRIRGLKADPAAAHWRPLLKLARGLQGDSGSAQDAADVEALAFADCFPGAAAEGHEATAEALPPAAVQHVRKLSAKVLMSKDFPLTRQQFMAIAEALSESDERYLAIKEFLETSFPRGFPVQFTIPVLPALSTTLSFTDARLCKHEPEVFHLPTGYRDVGQQAGHAYK